MVAPTPRTVSAADALARVASGNTVVLGTGCAGPQTLIEELVRQGERLSDVCLLTLLSRGPCDYARPEMQPHFRVISFFVTGGIHDAIRAGRADYLPCHISEIPRLFREGYVRPDVALIQVSPPDANGYCSLGISVDYLPAAVETASTVIAEMNARMPRTYGESCVHLSAIDLVVESSRPLITLNPPEGMGKAEEAIGCLVADLVPDGATVQLGIGVISDAVQTALQAHRNLRVHTGIITDAVLGLVRSGALTSPEEGHPSVVSTTAMGSHRLYAFMHENPWIHMYPCSYTHGAETLSRIAGLVSVNGALQIDLTGQVNAESLCGVPVSGAGGQLDFIRGAARVPGGRSIIALSSTARQGSVSRIVARLDQGAVVTTPRTDVEYVVTEYGVAVLRGKSLTERTRALAGIAHPRFRDELLAAVGRQQGSRLLDASVLA